MTRIIAGAHGGRRLAAPRRRADPARPRTGCGRRSSARSARWSTWPARASPTSTPAPARSAWRRCPGAPRTRCWSSRTPKAARVIRDNIATLGAGAGRPAGHRQGGQVLAGRRPTAGRTTWSSPTRRTRSTDDEVDRGASRRWSTTAGWRRTRWWCSSGRPARAIRGAPLSWVDGITAERSRRYGETTLWYGRRS